MDLQVYYELFRRYVSIHTLCAIVLSHLNIIYTVFYILHNYI